MRKLPTLNALAREWRLLLARGVLLATLGLATLLWPAPTLAGLITAVGAIVMLAAAVDLVCAAGLFPTSDLWWVVALEGLVGILLTGLMLGVPVVPMAFIALTAALWLGGRGLALVALAGEARTDLTVRAASTLWGWTSCIAALAAGLFWTDIPFDVFLYGLAGFALAWGLLEGVVALRLRLTAAHPDATDGDTAGWLTQ